MTYKEESKEHQNPDNDNDKYMDIATAKCDSAVWLPAGNYQVTSYTTYSKNGNLVKTLETQAVKGEQFTVKDNALTDDAIVPIKLSRTAEYIKDYLALKEIWDALNGKTGANKALVLNRAPTGISIRNWICGGPNPVYRSTAMVV